MSYWDWISETILIYTRMWSDLWRRHWTFFLHYVRKKVAISLRFVVTKRPFHNYDTDVLDIVIIHGLIHHKGKVGLGC